MKTILALLLLILPSIAGAYEVVSTDVTHEGLFERTDTVVSASADPLDRFTVHRYRNRYLPECAVDRVLILVPSLQSSWEMYLDGFAQALGFWGGEVWGITPRHASLTEECTGPGTCTVSGTWDFDSLLADVSYLRDEVETELPGRTVVIGGASMGAMTSIAAVNADPELYDGLLLLDGMLYSDDPAVLEINGGWCGAVSGMVASGIYYDGSAGDALKALVMAAQTDPDGPSVFMPGRTNKQAVVAFLDDPGPSPMSATPGFSLFAGDVPTGELLYSDEDRVFEAALDFLPFIPMVIMRDISCSLAGDPTHVSNLDAFQGSVYASGGERAFGGWMGPQLDLFTGADVTTAIDPGYGHMDSYYSSTWFEDLIWPVLLWMGDL